MNGTAFYRAREALDGITGKLPVTSIFSGDQNLDRIVNTVYSLMDTLIMRWTTDQWEAVHAYEEKGTFAKAASTFQVTWQNVQKHCQVARWDVIRSAEINLGMILERYFLN
jgi:hypothetical protein